MGSSQVFSVTVKHRGQPRKSEATAGEEEQNEYPKWHPYSWCD